jgi:hypothetical protein
MKYTNFYLTSNGRFIRAFDIRQEMIEAYVREPDYWRKHLRFESLQRDDQRHLFTYRVHSQVIRDHRAAVYRRMRKLYDDSISDSQRAFAFDALSRAKAADDVEILKFAE